MALAIGAGAIAAVVLVALLGRPIARGIGWLLGQVGRFVIGELTDVLRLVGAIITLAVLIPLVLLGIVVGRWSASGHFWRAIKGELHTFGLSLYRIAIGHPVRLLRAETLTEGIERRLPAVVRATPGADHPPRRVGQFDGYTIIGSLAGGGSGGKLYIAEPDEVRQASFDRQGHGTLDKVVIKSFSLRDGSTLPQIIRESRALDAAKKLGLVLEHELTDERFFYVMRYMPGDSLALVTQRMHGSEASGGLDGANLSLAFGFVTNLLRTLEVYHRGGLWHKDVKPDNIIIDGETAHLVDFGLVTPLRSAMTLTTHGTEYFRDPEMVRMALKGVKVHQIDGAKFDIYATGAVLFSVMENSFPSHGGLSQISTRCPDAVRWIVRRAMADYDKRYETASAMLADLETVRAAHDPFTVRPADLPSMGGKKEVFTADGAEERGDGVSVWSLVKEFAGTAFKTKRGEELRYEVHGNQVHTSRTNYPLHRGEFEKAAAIGKVAGPGSYGDMLRGPSYIWAILHDERIASRLWGSTSAATLADSHTGIGATNSDSTAETRKTQPGQRVRPRLTVVNWWTGRYHLRGKEVVAGVRSRVVAAAVLRVRVRGRTASARVQRAGTPARIVPVGQRRPAREQVERARARAQQARMRAHQRLRGHAGEVMGETTSAYKGGVSGGVAVAVGALTLCAVALVLFVLLEPGPEYAPTVTVQVGSGPQYRVGPGVVETAPVVDQPLAVSAPNATPLLRGGEPTDDVGRGGPGGLPGLALASALAGGAAIAANTNVLIVNEFIAPLDPRVSDAVGRLESELRSEGMRVLGDTLSPPDPDRRSVEINLLAQVQTVRQQRSFDSRAMIAEISDWIGRTEEVDYIIWIHSDADDATKPVLDPITFVSKTRTTRMFIEAMRNALVDQIVRSVQQ